jgi:hypothetical protein
MREHGPRCRRTEIAEPLAIRRSAQDEQAPDTAAPVGERAPGRAVAWCRSGRLAITSPGGWPPPRRCADRSYPGATTARISATVLVNGAAVAAASWLRVLRRSAHSFAIDARVAPPCRPLEIRPSIWVSRLAGAEAAGVVEGDDHTTANPPAVMWSRARGGLVQRPRNPRPRTNPPLAGDGRRSAAEMRPPNQNRATDPPIRRSPGDGAPHGPHVAAQPARDPGFARLGAPAPAPERAIHRTCGHTGHVGTCPACQRTLLARWQQQLAGSTDGGPAPGEEASR